MTEPTAVTPAEAIEQVRAARNAAIQPLRDQHAQLDRLISETELTLTQLKAEQKALADVLGKIDAAMPRPRKKGRGYNSNRDAANAERRARVEACIEALGGQAFGTVEVYEQLRADQNGGVTVGRTFVRHELARLHDLGVLVVIAKTAGGGFRYRRLAAASDG